MSLGQRAFGLLPDPVRHRLVDFAMASALGRARMGMLVRSLEALGCDRFALDELLKSVRHLDDAPITAAAAAERWADRGCDALAAGHRASGATYLQQATLFYALADWLADGAFKRANFAALMATADRMRSLEAVPTRRVTVAGCPAYWRAPANGANGCVVIVQGTNSSKDLFFSLEQMLVARGLAVLNIDQPGTGESLLLGQHMRQLDDLRPIADGVFNFLAGEPGMRDARVGVFGFSLGGFIAPAMCALDRRFGACAMVATGLGVDAALLDALPPQLKARAMAVAGASTWDEARHIGARALNLAPLASALVCPVRAFHGGRDTILPVRGARALYAAIGSVDKQLTVVAGGDHTCSTTLRSRVLPELFDWLADTLTGA